MEELNTRKREGALARLRDEKFIVSDRQLKAVSGGALWIATTVIVLGASFVPEVVPQDASAWRAILGLPSIAFGIALVFVGLRVPQRWFQPLVELCMVPSLVANLLMLQVTPATKLVLLNIVATIIYAGFFVRRRALIATVGAAIAIALSTLVTSPAKDSPQLGSFLVMYIGVISILALVLHSQNAETMRALARARRQARTDPLTGLANVRALEQAASRMFGRQSLWRSNSTPAVVLIDLDNFNSANASYGPSGGDHALRMIANQLVRVAPRGTLVARIGGDEFAVLLDGESRRRVSELAEILRAGVRAASSLMELPGAEIDATTAIALHPEDGDNLAELLHSADRAIYSAKGEKRHLSNGEAESTIDASTRPPWLDRVEPDGDRPAERSAITVERLTGGDHRPFASRTLYARASALAYLVGTLLLTASMLVPSAYPDPVIAWWVVLVAGLVISTGVLVANPSPTPQLQIPLNVVSMSVIATTIAFTGGIESPALLLLVLATLMQTWVMQDRLIGLRLAGPVIVALSPLFYTSIGSGETADVIDAMTLYGLCAVLITLVGAMYFDRVVLSRVRLRAERLAATDPLTGLANRRAFDHELREAIELGGPSFALVMLDLDNFKRINSEQGHEAGDIALRAIAESLQASSRRNDCVARIGGDEFALLLPRVDASEARALAERFVEAIAATPEAAACGVGASAGVALHPDHGETPDDLMFRAGNALIEAKAAATGSALVAGSVGA